MVVFGFGTFAVFGGVIFTVNLHVPAFTPFTLPAATVQMVFVVEVATTVDFATTVTPRVFSADSTVRLRWVRTGRNLGTAVEVTSGLLPGDLVVAEAARATDGQRALPAGGPR